MKLYCGRIIAAAILILSQIPVSAQKTVAVCAAPLPSLQPNAQLQRNAQEKILQQYIARYGLTDTDSVYTLPLVVHVIHTGSAVGAADNPSDAQILAMIQTLNNAWRKSGAGFGGVDMKIQFKLATRGPNCSSTTGIKRVNGSVVPNYSSGGIGVNNFPGSADEAAVKNLSRWSNTDYINIWIVNKINGTNVGIGGYAYFAEYSDAGIDGIVMNAFFANGNNQTLSHEMGHVFELFHTFYDDGWEDSCPRADSCSFYGDRVCDTEAGMRSSNCSNNINPCTGTSYQVADASLNYSVLHNYMNYTNCASMFTAGQKARVRAALHAFRPGLINSGALKPLPASASATACTPTTSFGTSIYYGVELVEFNTINVYSNTSDGDRAHYVDRTCNQRTTVYKGQTYPLRITGSHHNPHSFKAYLDFNNDGDFDDAGEELLSGYSSVVEANISIPSSGVPVGVPLRLRIVADNPYPGYPTYPNACQLNGRNDESGAGQVEDFSVIIANGPVQSVTSGAWNLPSTWNCNCVPVPGDEVTIKNGHSVFITQVMGAIEVLRLTIEAGASFNMGPNAILRQQKPD